MKKINLLLLMAVSIVCLSGCGNSTTPPIVTINDKNLYLKDFLYDIYLVEKDGNRLDKLYREKLGFSYWDYDCNGTTMREAAKSSVLASVVMYEILNDQAKQKGMALTENEKSLDEEEVKEIINSSPEQDLNSIGLSYDVLKDAYDKKALGDKYRNELSKNYQIDEQVIRSSLKQEDYREYKTECLFIRTSESKDNKIVQFSDQKKESAYTTITEVQKQLSEGTGIDSVLNSFSAITYDTRDFVYGDKTFETEYQDAAIILKNGDYSQIITTQYGYYIIHMLDNNSSARYEQAVEDAINAEEEKQFADIYNEVKKQYKITINFEYWDTITIGEITVPKK